MCTASNFITNGKSFFGRNYDYEISYKEKITLTPRNYKFRFKEADNVNLSVIEHHPAIIGITAGIIESYPLYYDATNEQGLCIAGLNFKDNAVYSDTYKEDKINLAPFELIPYLLSMATNVFEVKSLLESINIIDVNYSDSLPNSPLHWMISDANGDSLVVESVSDGLKVYDNKVGVLTNNPPFEKQLSELNKYRGLSISNPLSSFGIPLDEYSRGMGAIGLPGDYSSTSRFVKAAFVRANSQAIPGAEVEQFFTILDSVKQPYGLTEVDIDKYEYTIYSSCYYDGIMFYKTYKSQKIECIDMNRTHLDSKELQSQDLNNEGVIKWI